MGDVGLTSEQRAAIAVHNATQNRMCLNLSGNGQICVACSEVADQIDAAVEVERQRSQAALAAARRECEGLRKSLRELRVNMVVATCDGSCLCGNDEWLTWHNGIIDAALAAPAAGEEGTR